MTQSAEIRQIIEDPDNPGELILDLGPEICDRLGWQPGDNLLWADNGDGSWTLSKLPTN